MFLLVQRGTTQPKIIFAADLPKFCANRQSDDYPFVSVANVRYVYNIPAGLAAQSPNTNQMAMEFLPETAPLNPDVQSFIQMSNEVFTNYSKIFGPFSTSTTASDSTLGVELLMGLGSKGNLVKFCP